MNILVSNDDGILAPGITYLVKSLPDWAHVRVAAPATEKSASSHSISLKAKLKVECFSKEDKKYYAVHGTPADSVKFALSELTDFVPDLVLSGINHGTNTGISVFYSGTVSAAREAFINGIPAVALSLASPVALDFEPTCRFAHFLIEAYAAKRLPIDTMLNVNVPPLPWEKIKGIKITRQAPSRFVEEFVSEGEESGQKIFSLAGEIQLFDPDGTSDEEAISEGYISVTPLRIDLTHYQGIPAFEKWVKDLPKPETRNQKPATREK